MRPYVLTTGVIFGLLFAAHLLRILAESPGLARDPFYVLITLVAGALAIWSAWLLRRSQTA